MKYDDALILRNHLTGLLKMTDTAGKVGVERETAFEAAKEEWLKIYPTSPLKTL